MTILWHGACLTLLMLASGGFATAVLWGRTARIIARRRGVCVSCGYSLKGINADHRCPECGHSLSGA